MLLVAIEPVAGTVSTVAVSVAQIPPGKGEEFGKASPVAIVVILFLAVATALLIRGMTKRIKRLPASFDPPQESAEQQEPARDEPAGPAEDAGQNRP